MSSTALLWNADQLRAKLRKYDRTPFIDLLALWMECTPDVEVIEHFAEKYPDRFIRSMVELGKLSGFAEKSQIDVNLTAQVGALSDSQLEERLRQAAQRLGIDVPEMKVLELEAIKPETTDPKDQ